MTKLDYLCIAIAAYDTCKPLKKVEAAWKKKLIKTRRTGHVHGNDPDPMTCHACGLMLAYHMARGILAYVETLGKPQTFKRRRSRN